MTDILQITTTACMVAVGLTITWLTYDGLEVTGLGRDFADMAFHARRYVRRKLRQNAATWRAIINTNLDWGNK